MEVLDMPKKQTRRVRCTKCYFLVPKEHISRFGKVKVCDGCFRALLARREAKKALEASNS